jgi:thioredoxin 1
MKLLNYLLILSLPLIILSCNGSAKNDKKDNAKEYLKQQMSGSVNVQANPNEATLNSPIVILTDQNFRKEISSGIILVDFWATWCRPCRIQGPIIEELADEMKGKIKVGKMDVDENPAVSRQFGIESIPTMIIFKDGKEVKTLVGLHEKSALIDEINKIL